MDFFNVVGELGFASRLRRLSDVCMNEVKAIYENEGIKFDPKWFPLFSALLEKKQMSITEAANHLALTHPYVIKLANEMNRAKLITFKVNKADGRSRLIELTDSGRKLADTLIPVWQRLRGVVSQVIQEAEPRFLEGLSKVEKAIKQKPLPERMNEIKKAAAKARCQIIDYKPQLKKKFEALNREWLEKYFKVERVDEKYFENPKSEIINKGGDVFFAELDGQVVGTCALVKEGGQMEMAKMAVTASAQGQGIGEVLAREAIRRARAMGEKTLKLVTNSRLTPAISLYEKVGFKETFRGKDAKYDRGDLVMEMKL